MLAWWPVVRSVHHHALPVERPADVSHALPWRSVTAWLLSGFLVVQSWQFYSSLAWLSPTYESQGWSAAEAGLLTSVLTGTQLVSGLLAPVLLDRSHDWRGLLVGASALTGAGMAGIWLAPEVAPLAWVVVLGLGQGACFALALGLVVRFSVTPRDSARLSAMGFLLGYTVASAGPASLGLALDLTGSYALLWALLTAVAVPQLVLAWRLRPTLARVGERAGAVRS